MDSSLTSRVLWTDLSAWNNRWYVYVGAPLLAAIGATIGSLWGSHLASGEVAEALVMGSCIVIAMLVGLTILAVVDRRGSTDS
jgi:uncharacterized membrane protein